MTMIVSQRHELTPTKGYIQASNGRQTGNIESIFDYGHIIPKHSFVEKRPEDGRTKSSCEKNDLFRSPSLLQSPYRTFILLSYSDNIFPLKKPFLSSLQLNMGESAQPFFKVIWK